MKQVFKTLRRDRDMDEVIYYELYRHRQEREFVVVCHRVFTAVGRTFFFGARRWAFLELLERLKVERRPR